MAITFFKTPRHKTFTYRPVYWDQKKEEREKRLKTALEESNSDKEYEAALRDRMQLRWKRNSASRSTKNMRLRLILIFGFLMFLLYYLLIR